MFPQIFGNIEYLIASTLKTKKEQKGINIVTLGCSKNLVDSETLLRQLDANDLKVFHDDSSLDAKTVVINTCGFIKDSKQESIDTILRFIEAKNRGDIDQVYVMGCLSERYKPELEKEIPEVDQYFGVKDIQDIVKTLGYDYKSNLIGERLITTLKHYAYLKISEGCDRQCSFCAIPLIRGKHHSKSIQEVVKEAEGLVSNGVKELMLIAQDLTYYGVDIYRKQELAKLLKELVRVDGLEWIRLHYAYPANFPKDIIKLMAEEEKICNYLDIPFQHINNNVLKNMRRGVGSKQTYELIDLLRKEIPGLSLRTTLLTGHPGEGDHEFAELMEFVQKTKFNRLGVFAYSEEEDTFAARKFIDEIPEHEKQERVSKIMELQENISLELNQDKVGKTLKVLIDRKEGGKFIGRTEADSPEVDNEVILESEKELEVGAFYQAVITRAEPFDLVGKVV